MIAPAPAQRRRPPPDIPERTRPDAPSAQLTSVGPAARGPALPRLLVTAGPRRGAEFLLKGPVLTVGRAAGNGIAIADLSVSRRHLRLQQRRGGWVVLDPGSGNGTRVNGIEVRRRALRHGDEIELGDTRLRFLEPGGVIAWAERRSGQARGTAHLWAAAVVAVAIVAGAALVKHRRVRDAAEAEARAAELRGRAREIVAEASALAENGRWRQARERLVVAAELAPGDPAIARSLEAARAEAHAGTGP